MKKTPRKTTQAGVPTPASFSPKKRSFFLSLIALSVVGLILRLIVSAQLIGADPATTTPLSITDMATYQTLAYAFRDGTYAGVFKYQPFYYTVFLPVSFFLSGGSVWGVAILQSLCSAGFILLAGLCSAKLFGRLAGLLASFLATFSQMLILFVPYMLLEIQQAFWITLLFWFTLRIYERGKRTDCAFAGLTLAVAILSRGNAWCFFPFPILAAFFAFRRTQPSRRFRCAALALFLVCTLAPQLPYVIHNSITTGTLTGPSTDGGTVLAIGNNPESSPGGLEVPANPTCQLWWDSRNEISIPRRILNWAASEPAAFFELQFRKILLFWGAEEMPNNISLSGNGSHSGVLSVAGFIPSGVILLLAIVSFLLLLPKQISHKRFLLLFGFLFFYAMATAVFYNLERFRVPLLPLLCTAAGGAVPLLLWKLHGDAWKSRFVLLKTGTAVFLGIFFVYMANPLYRSAYEHYIQRTVRPNGIRVIRSSAETDYLDNGPMLCGSWIPIPIRTGTTIEKTFARRPDDPQANSCRLFLSLLTPERGALFSLSVNGGPPQSIFLEPSSMPLRILNLGPYPLPENRTFLLRFVSVDTPDLYALFDYQREYTRSRIDGKDAGCEAVLRLRTIAAPHSEPTSSSSPESSLPNPPKAPLTAKEPTSAHPPVPGDTPETANHSVHGIPPES